MTTLDLIELVHNSKALEEIVNVVRKADKEYLLEMGHSKEHVDCLEEEEELYTLSQVAKMNHIRVILLKAREEKNK